VEPVSIVITIVWLCIIILGATSATDVFWLLIGWGITLFVWFAVADAGRALGRAMSREQYNLTQNKYEIHESESDDPTRPNENLPAIIEVGRHYKRK
jgi:hypothetical protein